MITDFISTYENAIPVEWCEKFISIIEHYIENSVMMHEDAELHKKDHKTLNFHNDTTYDMSAGNKLPLEFLPLIKDYVDEYLKKYSVLGKERFLLFDVKAKKIPIGGGFHEWHYENPGVITSPRKLVIQLYLNTIDEGGETEFLYINKRIKAKQGSLIIFPAAFTHTHRGNPPIGQDKYILSTWATSQDKRF